MKLLFLFASRDLRKPFFQRRSFQFRFATERLVDFFSLSTKTVTECFIKKEIPSFFFSWKFSRRWQPFSRKTEMRNEKKELTAYCIRVELDETIEIWKSILVLVVVNNMKRRIK
ncbi:hypothetical protein CEXT_813611 [Caerostris extrusa]|uniref:Uncharacterized protein n=1 Tax=Caerostris extrusa TaxID=172846 RepID=A0AAV4YBW3_CAEEX|nr:hypothetical protein CEXT_813611 [Caerostris extrusa]